MNNKTKKDFIKSYTDNYFLKSKQIIKKYGDVDVTYAVFIRRPGIVALKLAIDWIKSVAKERKIKIQTNTPFKEGEYFGAGEPILYIKGSFQHMVDLETLFLQKIGPACIAAANAYQMCIDLPKTSFIAMDARHCAGSEMSELMSYAASVGSKAAKKNKNVDLAIFNAAVADYRVENYQKQKIKRNKNLTLKLKNNPDILKTISNISSGPQITVGFAYETNDVKANALKKLKKKNCDYLVLNYPISKNNIFNNKYNNGGIFNKKGHYHQIGNVTKTSFANQVLRHILKAENE